MNELARTAPKITTPSTAEAQREVDRCRRMFQRTLSTWVCDLLSLRSAGLTRPRWRPDRNDYGWNEAA